MSFQVKKDIEEKINNIVAEGCHVMKTGDQMAVFTFCNNKKLEEKRNVINKILEPYRINYSVYLMTESDYLSRKVY